MTEICSVVACSQCQVHWCVDDEPAKCTDPDHDHQPFDLHQHLSVVVLTDGTEVTAASFDARDPYARAQRPDYGLYLDPQWEPPWSHDHLDWPDFGVPEDPLPVAAALSRLLERARGRDRVEVGCSVAMGGPARPWLAWPS